jgi:hypothetical protein
MLYLALTKHISDSTTDLLAAAENPLELLPVLEDNIRAEITRIEAERAHHQQLKEKEAAAAAAGSKVLVVLGDPPPPPSAPDSYIQWPRFYRAAARVLWIATTPDELLATAASFDALQATIDTWADTHLPDAHLITAIRLAHQIRTEHRDSIVIPRPIKDGAKADSGNSPCPASGHGSMPSSPGLSLAPPAASVSGSFPSAMPMKPFMPPPSSMESPSSGPIPSAPPSAATSAPPPPTSAP